MENVVVAHPSSSSAPVETLPPEILREIFQAFAFGKRILIYFLDSGRLSFLSSLFTLPRVCSLWRKVSLSQPSLWSTLTFSLIRVNHFVSPENIAKNEASLREVLQLTNVTLCLEVVLGSIYYPIASNVNTLGVMSALRVFAEYAHRYRNLTFRSEEKKELIYAWEIFKSSGSPASGGILDIDVDEGPLPHLENLSLICSDHDSDPPPVSHAQCPRLHTLNIFSLHSSALTPGLKYLTTLRTKYYTGGDLTALLANYPLLRSLQVDLFIGQHSSTSHPHPARVDHTNLKTLICGSIQMEGSYNARVWDSVHLPNLTGLGLKGRYFLPKSGRGELAGSSFHAMKAMLIRSKCTLENVSLYNIPKDVLAEFFREVSMREGCRNGRTVYNLSNKVLTVFPPSADLPDSRR